MKLKYSTSDILSNREIEKQQMIGEYRVASVKETKHPRHELVGCIVQYRGGTDWLYISGFKSNNPARNRPHGFYSFECVSFTMELIPL